MHTSLLNQGKYNICLLTACCRPSRTRTRPLLPSSGCSFLSITVPTSSQLIRSVKLRTLGDAEFWLLLSFPSSCFPAFLRRLRYAQPIRKLVLIFDRYSRPSAILLHNKPGNDKPDSAIPGQCGRPLLTLSQAGEAVCSGCMLCLKYYYATAYQCSPVSVACAASTKGAPSRSWSAVGYLLE